jgi:hypothetical protein
MAATTSCSKEGIPNTLSRAQNNGEVHGTGNGNYKFTDTDNIGSERERERERERESD